MAGGVADGPLAKRPRSLGDLFDAAAKLYTGNIKALVCVCAVIIVSLQLLSAILSVSIYSDGRDIGSALQTSGRG